MPPSKAASAALFVLYLAVNLGALLLAAKSQRQPRSYLNSTAVTLSELLKLMVSIIGVYASSRSTSGAVGEVGRTLFGMPDQMLRVAMPSLLYTIQNNIIYTALSHLDAVSFQITYQLKIVFALLSSRILLRKKVSTARWTSVLLLTIGVVLVQLSLNESAEEQAEPATTASAAEGNDQNGGVSGASTDERGADQCDSAIGSDGGANGSGGGSSTDNGEDRDGGQQRSRSRLLGLAGVLLACICSGLAGSVMELLLKGTALPLAQRNMQVAFVSLLLASVHMITNDASKLRSGGFFQGYSPLVWAMVTLDSVGGILVSMLLKYTSATLKNFGAPIGIILNVLFSRYAMRSNEFKPTPKFLIGTLLVLLALGFYSASA